MPYKKSQMPTTALNVNQSVNGETIEQKLRRILNNKEPITDSAPIIYTERKDGVKPEHNPRTDRFEIAVEAMDTAAKSHQAKREERHKPKETPKETPKPNGGAESIQATGSDKA